MEDIEELISAHLAAWNAPAGPNRSRLIAAAYAPAVYIAEPQGALHGHDGMEQAIAGLQAQLPQTTITRTGPVQVSQDMVTYAWSLGASEGPAAATGRDVLIVSAGKVVSLYVVIDQP
jgi:hypothetical protein